MGKKVSSKSSTVTKLSNSKLFVHNSWIAQIAKEKSETLTFWFRIRDSNGWNRLLELLYCFYFLFGDSMFYPNKHLHQGNPDSTQLDLPHESYNMCFYTKKKDYSCISPGFPNFYNIYSFTSSKILTSFGEPDAPGSCLVHTGPAFHASVSPQSQNPPPVELCICKRHKFQLWNMYTNSETIEMCIIYVKHKYKYLPTK